MKVEIELLSDITEPYITIHTNSITDEIQKIISSLETSSNIIIANDNEKMIILHPNEIYMVRIENSKVVIYCENNRYLSKKRLFEIGEQLGKEFMQISKSAFVNLKQIDCIEPFFNSMMNLKLKNGCSEYISRKYLPEFKKYLGL